MDRVKRVTYFIELFYELYGELPNEELVESFYDFLVDNGDKKAVNVMADHCNMSVEDIEAHRDDMMLDIILNYYKFIRCCHSENQVNDKEKEMLKRFDDGEFEAVDLVFYFTMEENKEQVKEMINQYCIFKTQKREITSSVDEYNMEHPTSFLEKLNKHIDYVNTCDAIAKIYNDTVDEHVEDDDEDEDDYEDDYDSEYDDDSDIALIDDDDEYEEWALDMANQVLLFIHSKYPQAEEFNAFIRYYISLIYATLLVQREEKLLTKQNAEVLKAIESKSATVESIIAVFQKSDNFFMGIELVSQEYTDTKGELFDLRYQFDDEKTGNIFKMLDPRYTVKSEVPERTPFIVIGTIIDKIDEVLMHFKLKYPDNYEDRLYEFLLSEFCPDDGILYEHDIEEQFYVTFKLFTIRYVARKFYESTASREIIDLTMGESHLFQALSFADKSTTNMIKIFYDGGISFLHAYFDLANERESVEKDLIRRINDRNEMATLGQIDPLCVVDEIVHKALNQGTLYSILEEEGISATIQYLKLIEEKKPVECENNIGELLTEVYDILKKKKDLDETETVLLKYIENTSWSVREYKNDLFMNEQLLMVLLTKYLLGSPEVEYNMYEVKDEGYQKIKQRLQGRNKQDNQRA